MKSAFLAMVAVFGLTTGAALAAEGNGNPFPFQAPGQVTANPLTSDTGSQAYPNFAVGEPVPVIEGQVLPQNGSEGSVQTANSLPPGFENGTAAYEEAQRVARYFASQAPTAPHGLASNLR